jgi:hypothetical protein
VQAHAGAGVVHAQGIAGEVLAQRLVQAHVAEHAAFLQLRLAL